MKKINIITRLFFAAIALAMIFTTCGFFGDIDTLREEAIAANGGGGGGDLAFEGPTLTKTYGDLPFIHTVSKIGKGSGAISYSSSDTSVAEVESDGENAGQVTIKKAGNTTITATKAGDGTIEQAEASYYLIVEKKSISLTVGPTGHTLVPFEPSPVAGNYRKSTTFNVNVASSGLVGSDKVTVTISGYGLSLANNSGITNNTKVVTLNYDGTTTVAQTTAFDVALGISGNDNYTLSGTNNVSVTIKDGQAEARAIPLSGINFAAFNIYVRNALNKHYILTENYSLGVGYNNWTPIGSNLEWERFTGTFNGNGFTISDINVPRSSSYTGFFGYVDVGGTVKNLSVSGSVWTNVEEAFFGGIAGHNAGTIQNCNFQGEVSANWCNVGGVVGTNYGTVDGCYSNVTVRGHFGIGGVVGQNLGIVKNCYSTGTISGISWSIGGVVGDNYGKVQNCYFIASVTDSVKGNYFIGGVVGFNENGGIVENCYSAGSGSISSTGTGSLDNSSVGGVVGCNEVGGVIRNCYSAIATVSARFWVGGIAGDNYGTVVNCVALNKSIVRSSGTETLIGRIVGYNSSAGASISSCYGRSDMTLPTGTLTGHNGTSVTSSNWYNTSWWTSAGNWNSSYAWSFGTSGNAIWQNATSSRLPILRNMPASATQNPTVAL